MAPRVTAWASGGFGPSQEAKAPAATSAKMKLSVNTFAGCPTWGSCPASRFQSLPKSIGEYHRPPRTNELAAATSTAKTLMPSIRFSLSRRTTPGPWIGEWNWRCPPKAVSRSPFIVPRGLGENLRMKRNTVLSFLAGLLLTIATTSARLGAQTPGAAGDQKPWLVIEGKEGPGKGKHIVLISGDEEYR